jgi:hypothetical protein
VCVPAFAAHFSRLYLKAGRVVVSSVRSLTVCGWVLDLATDCREGRENGLFRAILCEKCIILPRQARDNHKEKLTQRPFPADIEELLGASVTKHGLENGARVIVPTTPRNLSGKNLTQKIFGICPSIYASIPRSRCGVVIRLTQRGFSPPLPTR